MTLYEHVAYVHALPYMFTPAELHCGSKREVPVLTVAWYGVGKFAEPV